MRTLCSVFVMLGVALGAARPCPVDDAPKPSPDLLAARTRALCDAIQAHHVEAPTRQHLIHSGIVAMYRAVGVPLPPGLGERLSGLATPEQFAALMAEVRPEPGGDAATEAALDQAFLQGLAESVPGGAWLMAAKESKVAEQLAGNRYVGIQIQVAMDKDSKLPVIQGTLGRGPAERAGMKAGDVIEAVDGVDLGGGTLPESIDKLRGAEGTEVVVRARRAGEKAPLTFRMTREAMHRPTISGPGDGQGYRLPGADPIGYIRISEILASTPREVREAAAKMEAEGLKALILDLRGILGPGRGDLHATILLADELLDAGTIGRVRLADREVVYRAEPGAVFRDWPIAVLVDRAATDHAEWLAAALMDNKRAKVVGVTTAGLGTTRSTVPIGDGAQTLTLVTGLLQRADGRPIGFYVPSNVNFQMLRDGMNAPIPEARYGVTPDLAITEGRSAGRNSDPSMKAAVELLGKTIRPTREDAGERGASHSAPDGRGSR